MLWALTCPDDPAPQTGPMRVVALLRGVNLGPSRGEDGRPAAAVESLGHRDVETYLESGNVVFTRMAATRWTALGALADARDGRRHADQDREEMARSSTPPLPGRGPDEGRRRFLAAPADAAPAKDLDLAVVAPDELTVKGTEVYLSLPNGQARSKLVEALWKRRALGATSATARNWRTVLALAEMSR